MPTYVFLCSNPGCVDPESDDLVFEFEVIQAMNDTHAAKCPKCGRPGKQVMFPPAISFKGSGFHVNDYPGR